MRWIRAALCGGAARNLTLIEGIEILDSDREHMMASWVHLTRDANERIATALRDTLVAKGGVQRPDHQRSPGNRAGLGRRTLNRRRPRLL